MVFIKQKNADISCNVKFLLFLSAKEQSVVYVSPCFNEFSSNIQKLDQNNFI